MTDLIDDFLDFGEDDALSDQFATEYANINRCDGSPSSEEAELNPLEHSTAGLSRASRNGVDLEMSDFKLGASLGSSWTGVSDSFSQMHVKSESMESDALFDDAIAIPGSWPASARSTGTASALRASATALKHNQIPTIQNPHLLQPAAAAAAPVNGCFSLSQIAPPSLPQECSVSTAASSICSDIVVVKEEDDFNSHESDLVEPARKRRASETKKKSGATGGAASNTSSKAGHKRSTSNASSAQADMKAQAQEAAAAPAVGTLELDESGDPVVAKRQDRLMRNRAAALASRERKREHVSRLESAVHELERENARLRTQLTRVVDELKRVRVVLESSGVRDAGPMELAEVEAALQSPRVGGMASVSERESEHAGDIVMCDDQVMATASTSASATKPAVTTGAAPTNPNVTKVKPPPTGFSPRGALKKSEIIANHLRAEEHLRNITLRQAELDAQQEEQQSGDADDAQSENEPEDASSVSGPASASPDGELAASAEAEVERPRFTIGTCDPTADENKDATPRTFVPVSVSRHTSSGGGNSTKPGTGGSVVFMILIFGIALFASANTATGKLDLTGFNDAAPSSSHAAGGGGLVLNLPQSFGEDVSPETVIRQLRGQGFLLSEELEANGVENLILPATASADWLARAPVIEQGKTAPVVPGEVVTVAAPVAADAASTPATVAEQSAKLLTSSATTNARVVPRSTPFRNPRETIQCRRAMSAAAAAALAAGQATTHHLGVDGVEVGAGLGEKWQVLRCEVKEVVPLT